MNLYKQLKKYTKPKYNIFKALSATKLKAEYTSKTMVWYLLIDYTPTHTISQ